jgi:hypothetical protein
MASDDGRARPQLSDAQGDTWRTVGKHPLLELRHTVEDRLLIATHVTFLGLRAMLHRNGDAVVLFSDTIDEPRTQGNAVGAGTLARPPDRLLVLTDKHLYVVGSPSVAIFAPAAAGSCYALSEFARMAVISNANSAVIQFVGGIVAARFSSRKDCERCAAAVYGATGVPADQLSAQELDALQQRHAFGSSMKISRFVMQTLRDAQETASDASGTATTNATSGTAGGRKRVLRNDNGAVTTSVDNMLRFVLDNETELAQFDAGFPTVAVQATCDTDDVGVSARPDMVDAATSPVDFALDAGAGGVGGLNTRTYARRFDFDGDGGDGDDGGDVGDTLWSSLRGAASQPRVRPSAGARGGARESGGSAKPSADPFRAGGDPWSFANHSLSGPRQATPKSDDAVRRFPAAAAAAAAVGGAASAANAAAAAAGGEAAAFDAWLGVLSVYRAAMEEHGITSANRLLRIPPGPSWEAFLDECGITRAGHRVLLTTKAAAARK